MLRAYESIVKIRAEETSELRNVGMRRRSTISQEPAEINPADDYFVTSSSFHDSPDDVLY